MVTRLHGHMTYIGKADKQIIIWWDTHIQLPDTVSFAELNHKESTW